CPDPGQRRTSWVRAGQSTVEREAGRGGTEPVPDPGPRRPDDGRRGRRGRLPAAQPVDDRVQPAGRRRLVAAVSELLAGDLPESEGGAAPVPVVAVVGTGRMGAGMATRLGAAGAELI